MNSQLKIHVKHGEVKTAESYNNDIKISVVHIYDGNSRVNDIFHEFSCCREKGAEFILGICHYNNICDNKVQDDQVHLAKTMASAGANYIIGYSSSDYIQPYDLLRTEDDRVVPVLYSAGNLTVEIVLTKTNNKEVEIISEGYYPSLCGLTQDERLEEMFRINFQIGTVKPFRCLAEEYAAIEDVIVGRAVNPYAELEIQPISIINNHNVEYAKHCDCHLFGYVSEANIICAGQIEYDSGLERTSQVFDEFNFFRSFQYISNCFKDANIVVGNLATMSSQAYPNLSDMPYSYRKEHGYNNCRPEYITALAKAGFGCLAVGNIFNAGMGMQGIFDTEKVISENGMITSGIGSSKDPTIEINGIKIAVLSTTVKCINHNNVFTDYAKAKYTNIYDASRMNRTIKKAREDGAEFILVYVNCGNGSNKIKNTERKVVAEAIAEMGADYVICTVPKTLAKYYHYKTIDGRTVPVAPSLGSLISGNTDESFNAALLRLNIRRDFNGDLYCNDSYIPIKFLKDYNGNANVIMPAAKYFNGVEDFDDTRAIVREKLGSVIDEQLNREVSLKSKYTATLTIKEIYESIGKKPTPADLKAFGGAYEQEVSCIAPRKQGLEKGCAAIFLTYDSEKEKETSQCNIEECIKAGAVLVIDNKPHPELPCIVVKENIRDVYTRLIGRIRDKYNPLTVAITGSMGKTTTKELTSKVFETVFKTLHVSGNYNTIPTIGQVVQKLEKGDGAYIQEVSGGSFFTASESSKMIKPDICIITNIEKNHIEVLGSLDNIVKSKMGIIDGLKPKGVLIINNDNKILQSMVPNVRTIRYSISDKNCHYYATDIQTEANGVRFNIVSADSDFDQAGIYPAVLNVHGEHNISNALAAFAAGRQAGIPPHEIILGLSKYRTKRIRQNIVEYKGIRMIVDVYNSNPVALNEMFKVFQELTPAKNGKKIAVLGMMGELGENSANIHYETGKAICQYDFDMLFCYGEDAKHMAEGVRTQGREAFYFTDRKVFNKAIAQNITAGDVVLFKASHSMNFYNETILPIFGKFIK